MLGSTLSLWDGRAMRGRLKSKAGRMTISTRTGLEGDEALDETHSFSASVRSI